VKKYPDCKIVINGGTECWLHSNKTEHLPGNSIVDIDDVGSFVKYVEEGSKKKNSSMGYPIYIKDGTEFLREPNHYHIIKW
jgi:hypothetical protein